jgi:hypothetical protein
MQRAHHQQAPERQQQLQLLPHMLQDHDDLGHSWETATTSMSSHIELNHLGLWGMQCKHQHAPMAPPFRLSILLPLNLHFQVSSFPQKSNKIRTLNPGANTPTHLPILKPMNQTVLYPNQALSIWILGFCKFCANILYGVANVSFMLETS